MFWVYVLKSRRTGRRYVGCTADLLRRIEEHNRGQTRATRGGAPWDIVHREGFPSHAEALLRERFLKSGRGRRELDGMVG
ncbi:MAG: GIY-YIG nuclease family protein [Verrucomicrobiae bacterium]|nr:GIY-YIG nuclease family protein [Verrucomicrobiae bacterium]